MSPSFNVYIYASLIQDERKYNNEDCEIRQKLF